jgi:serine/threonine protein kinase
MTSDATLAFQERIRAAALALASQPENRESRHELESLLAYGEGARTMFDAVLEKLIEHDELDRRGAIILRAFAERRARMSAGDLENDPVFANVGFDPAEREDATVFRDENSPAQDTKTDDAVSDRTHAGPIPFEIGDRIGELYTIQGVTGVGGMSVIYRAVAEGLSGSVAIKVLKTAFIDQPAAVAAFEREASLANAIDHPSIVKIHGSSRHRQHPYIVMEFLDGQPLSRVLNQSRERPVSWQSARDMLRAVGPALAAAHNVGIVHCDIKSGNIFLLNNGGYRVLDFGIARRREDDRTNLGDTSTELDPGPTVDEFTALTPAYASYEMLTGQPPDPRDDIFSLSIIVYQMLAGHHPFDRLPADEARLKHLQPRCPAALPKRFWPTLEAGLSFERADRPATVTRFLAGFRRPVPWFTLAVVALSAGLLAAAYLQPAASQALFDRLQRGGLVVASLFDSDINLIEQLDGARRNADPGFNYYVDLLEGPVVQRVERLTSITDASPPSRLDQASVAVEFARRVLPGHPRLKIWLNRVSKALLQRISVVLRDTWPIPVEVARADLAALEIVDPDNFKTHESLLIDIMFHRLRGLANDAPRLRALNQAGRELFPNEPWVDLEAPSGNPVTN